MQRPSTNIMLPTPDFRRDSRRFMQHFPRFSFCVAGTKFSLIFLKHLISRHSMLVSYSALVYSKQFGD